MPGGDQNSVEDTSQLFKVVDILRNNGITATIVFIHHLSKMGEVRGSTNIEAEVDVVTSVEKTKLPGIIKLLIRRARSLDETTSYMFKLTSYFLGTTVQGHKLHAPIVELIEVQNSSAVGDVAKVAASWNKLCTTLLDKLGVGKSPFDKLYDTLCNAGYMERSKARRPRGGNEAIQKPMKEVFSGKVTWSFGDYWFSLLRSENNDITGLEIRDTK